MGYDVSIELRSTGEREAYDAAAERMHIHHDIDTWGDAEPSEWQVKTLWSGGSFVRGLAEFLSERGTRVEGEDGYCPSYVIPPDLLIRLGDIYTGLTHGSRFAAHMTVIENLGLISDEDAFEYWHNLERGVTSKTCAYVPMPVVRNISLPDLRGSIVHDDDAAPISRDNTEAWDAYVAYVTAEREVADAPDEAKAQAKAHAEEAKARYEAALPRQDTVSLHGATMDVSIYEHGMSVETEHLDPLKGAQFKADVVMTLRDAMGSDYDVSDLYDVIADSPGLMLMTFQRLGEIGQAAKGAHIDELVVSPSW